MNDLGCIQNSPEWYAARLGMATASKVKALIAQPKKATGELKSRRDMKLQLLAEMLTSRTKDNYVSMAMEWGIENEGRARADYESETGLTVEPVGLLLHPAISRAAASPDGFVAPDGLLEIKCPETFTHLSYMEAGVVPEDYRDQMDWQMACAGPEIKWCDFVSYDPRLKPELQLFIVRRHRDDKRIAEMESLVMQALEEVAQMAEAITSRKSKTEIQLERSLEARKAFRKLHDAELMEQLRDEGIQVP